MTNPVDAKRKFHVEILDDDFKNDYIDDHELTLVDDSDNQWSKWHKQGKCTLPLDMGFVNADQMEIELEPNQEVKLLFKFLSYREPVAIKEDNKH